MKRPRRPETTTRPLIVAHRGGAPHDVENSLPAFVHGLQVGSDVIECDLRTAAGGDVVLYHDAHAGGDPVSELSVDELRERVPTLVTYAEFVDWASSHPEFPRIVLDLKEREIDRRIVASLRDAALRDRVLVTTQHSGGIRRLTAEFPDLRIGLSRGHAAAGADPPALRPWIIRALRPVLSYWLLPQLRWSRATTVVVHHGLVSPRNVRQFQRAGLRVYVWTVDDCVEAQRLAHHGVDLIATNAPWLLRGCLGLFDDP
jgi:glycerophosphoryl diester phosphodiesterase